MYTFETDRINIRSLLISDAKAIFNNWASDDEVTKYMRWDSHKSVNDTKNWIINSNEKSSSGKHFDFLLVYKENGESFGSVSLHHNDEYNMFEVSYILMKKYWNYGLATEAVKGLIEFAVQTLGQKRLFARHEVTNVVSGKVLLKSGFVFKNEGRCLSLDGKKVSKSKEYFYIL